MAEDVNQRIARLERDFGASMQQIAHSLSELEGTQFEQGALLKEHGRALVDIRKRLGRVEATMATKQDVEGLATKAEVEALRTEMGELRTQVLASFQQVLAVLDERLPGKE